MVGRFILELQFLGVEEEHHLDVVDLERRKHIVLVGVEIFVAGQCHVAFRREADVAHRKLLWQILLPVQRVGQFAAIVVFVVAEAMGIVAFHKEVGVQVGRGLSADAQTQSVVEVLGNHGVDGSHVELTGLFARAGL